MKKLMFILTTLLATFATASAEVIGGADAATEIFVSSQTEMTLLGKGLLVTAGGLGGTFLVLILFYLVIKLLQKVLK